jgi:hypothetical protein
LLRHEGQQTVFNALPQVQLVSLVDGPLALVVDKSLQDQHRWVGVTDTPCAAP